MGVTITKKQKAEPDAEVGTLSEQCIKQELVDEYFALQAKVAKHKAKYDPLIAADEKRLADIKAGMVAVVDETKAADEKVKLLTSDGAHEIEISAKTNQTTLTDLEGAKKMLGKDLFFTIAKIGITDLKDYLTKPQLMTVTKTEQTGARRFKAE